jgi:polygalacturonase
MRTLHHLAALGIAVLLLAGTHARAQNPASGVFNNILSYGASPEGKEKCTQAIASAIDAASARGGGTIYFPAGTYLTGPIHLKSNITLFVDAGATIKFSTDFDDYLPMVPSRWEGITVTNFSPLIYANKAENIAIVGRGTLDGQGKAWWDYYGELRRQRNVPKNKYQEMFAQANAERIKEMNYDLLNFGFLRPPFIQPYECNNVLIEGVNIRNSPFWTVTPVFCENVTVRAVTIINPTSPNTDGINPDSCHNVHISDSYISVGDDCITIKSGRDIDGRRIGKPAENYTITNCTMANGHGGVVIGSEMSGGVKNITISNCIFDGTDRGIRMKSTRGRGGVVEDVRVSNIVMRNIREEAIILTMHYTRTSEEPVSERTPIFRNIHINGMTGDARIACDLTGLTEMPIENITFNDIQLDTDRGFAITDGKNIALHNVTVNARQGPVVRATRTSNLELDGIKTLKPLANVPTFELSAVKDVFVHDSIATEGTGTFLRVDPASADAVTMEGNYLARAKQPVEKAAPTTNASRGNE